MIYLRGGRPGVRLETVRDDRLGPELECFRYFAFGLAGSRAEDYLARPEAVAAALAALMRAETLSRPEHKMACKRAVIRKELNELQRFLLANFVETYLELKPAEAAEYAARLAQGENREVRTMEMTWAERMEAQYREQFREQFLEQGLEQGREEGRRQGIRQIVLQQLGRRFGPLPEPVKRRVEAITSPERLTQLAEQVLVARSLEEMGLG